MHDTRICSDKAFDKHQILLLGVIWPWGRFNRSRQFPSFTLKPQSPTAFGIQAGLTHTTDPKVYTTKERTPGRLMNVWSQFRMSMTVDTAIQIVLTVQRCTS